MKYSLGKILQAVGYVLFVVAFALKISGVQFGYVMLLIGIIVHIVGYRFQIKEYEKENEKLKATIVKLTNQRSA